MLCPTSGPSDDGAFWLASLRGLVARGLSGTQLVTSDAHEGLKAAICFELDVASWQRCRVPFVRSALALVPKPEAQLVARHHGHDPHRLRQPEAEVVRQQWRHVADGLRPRCPQLATLLDEAEVDVLAYLAYLAFPAEHWRDWAPDLEQHSSREAQPRGQAPLRSHGHLPQRGGYPAPGRHGARCSMHSTTNGWSAGATSAPSR